MACVDDLVFVVPADVRAVAAALPVVARRSGTARAGVVVRRLAGATLPAPQVADTLSLPLLGELRAEPTLPAGVHATRPLRIRRRGPLAELCGRLLEGWERSAAVAA